MTKRLPIVKSGFSKRRKVMVYIIACILIIGIVAGFTNTFTSDNRKFAAMWGETIVMEAEPPKAGSPEDYDLISNLKFTAYKLHHSAFFRGETNGKVLADITIGTYTQNIHNTRYSLGGNKVFAETISSSSLKSVAEQKYAEDGIIIYRPSVSINGSSAKFSDSAYSMPYEEYSKKYGTVPNQLSKYIISEKSIIAVKDENAPAKSAVNAANAEAPSDEADEGGFDFYVPEGLVKGADGNYKFTLTLDAFESTLYYRNEVRTLGGADQNPKFYSVRVTVTIDENWNPVSVRSVENYDIAIPVLGAMNCTGDLTEVFTQIDDADGALPEADFFAPYVEQAKNNPEYKPPEYKPGATLSPSDYLATAFADYMTGAKPLDLKANIKIGDFSAYDLKLSLNLKTMDVRAALGNALYVNYSGGKVQINLGEINGYLDTAAFGKLMNDEVISQLIGGLDDIDTDELFGGDMLDTLFKNCEMTTENGVVRIRLPFDIDLSGISKELGKANVDASLFINDEDKALRSITGKITVAGKVIDADITPLKTMPTFPSTDGAKDLSGITDFISAAAATFTQKTFGIDGTVNVNGTDIGLSAYIDLTDGVKADGTVSIFGMQLSVKYADDILQIECGDIKVRGTADELPELLSAVLDLADFGKYTDLLKGFIPSTLNELVGMVRKLDVTEDRLTLGLNVLTMPIDIELTRKDGLLSGLTLDASVDMLGIKADASVDLAITYPEKHDVVLSDGEFITVSALAALIGDLKPYLDFSKNYTVTVDGSVSVKGSVYSANGEIAIDRTDDGIDIGGTINALGQNVGVVYTNGTAYIDIGNIKVKLSTASASSLLTPVQNLIGLVSELFAGATQTSSADLLGSVTLSGVGITENGKVSAIVTLGETPVNICLDIKSGTLEVNSDLFDLTLGLELTDAVRNISAPHDADKFIDVAEFDDTVTAITDIIREQAFTATLEAEYGGNTYRLNMYASVTNGTAALEITEPTLPLDISYVGGKAYISLGNIKLTGSVEDATALVKTILGGIGVELDNIVAALPDLGAVDIEQLTAAVLGAISDIAVNNGILSTTVTANGKEIVVRAALDLSEIAVSTTVNGEQLNISLGITAGCRAINAPSGQFTEIADFVPTVKVISSLMQSTAFAVDYGVSVKTLTDTLEVNGNACIDISSGFAVSANASVFGATLNAVYADNTVYISIGNIRLALPVDELESITDPAKELLAAVGIKLPALQIPSVGIADIFGSNPLEKAAELLGAVKTVAFDGDTLVIGIEIEGTALTLNITPNDTDGNISASAVVSANGTEATLVFNVAPSTSTVTAPNDADKYSDITELGETVTALAEFIKSKALSATVGIELDGKRYTAEVAISLADGDLAINITEKTLPLDITVKNGTAYIALGDIKVSGKLTDVTELKDLILSNIPEAAAPYVQALTDKLGGVLEKLDGATSALDIESVLSYALDAVKKLTVSSGNIVLEVVVEQVAVTFTASTNLGGLRVDVEVPAGMINSDKALKVSAVLENVSPVANIPVPVTAEYVPATQFISLIAPILPLAGYTAFEMDLEVTVFEQTLTGNIYVDLGDYTAESIGAQITLDLADVPVIITVKNKTLYIDVNNGGVRLAQPLGGAALGELIAALDAALPKLGIADSLQSTVAAIDTALQTKIDILDIIRKISVAPVDGGFEIALGITDSPVLIKVLTGDAPNVTVSCTVAEKALSADMSMQATDGVLSAVNGNVTFDGTEIGIGITVASADKREISVSDNYITPDEFIRYIPAALDLLKDADGASSVTLDLEATVVLANKALNIGGQIAVSLEPFALSADIRLFDKTNDPQLLSLLYINDELFIETGKIRLSFNIARDLQTLYSSLEQYIPEYLKELTGMDAFGGLTAMIKNFKTLASATDIQSAFSVLFAKNAAGKTLAKQAVDMITVFKRTDDITVGVNVLDTPMTVTLNVTPLINNDKLDIMFDTVLGSFASISGRIMPSFENTVSVAPPTNPENYTPVVTFVKTILDAVNTFTAKAPDIVTTDKDGNTTTVSQTSFEIDAFAFDYDMFKIKTTVDENGNTVEVKDEITGRPVIEQDANGKMIDRKVEVSGKKDTEGNDQKILRFSITDTTVTDAEGNISSKSSKIAVEAHFKLNIKQRNKNGELVAMTGFPIELDLYVAPTKDHPEGLAYLYYKEANGFGEKLSIDYTSVMQMIAAVMDIIGVNDATIDALLKDYRLPIDTTVFDSMAIDGIDSIRALLDGAARAVDEIKAALKDVKNAWSRFQTAGSIDALVSELTDDGADETIKSLLSNALSHIKTAIAQFKTEDDTIKRDTEMFNGAVYGKVVGSVEFGTEGNDLFANVSNEIATGTEGWAKVSVTSENNKVTAVGVDNLDVNTAKLNTFDLRFAATQNIEINIPDDYTVAGSKESYSDFANIKHLIFDVMNTANLMEFEIGGINTSDSINVHMKLGADWLANIVLNIKYDVKVKIINVGNDSLGKPIYKTAASVELYFSKTQLEILNIGSKVIIPECTTRLFFYDDVLYVQGLRSWQSGSENRVVGEVTNVRAVADVWGRKEERTPTRTGSAYSAKTTYWEYVEVMYSVEEFFWMIKNDMNKFLDEFLYYLVPLTTEKIAGQDIRGLISNNIGGSSSDTEITTDTIAQIFKGYTYTGGKHSLTIGLAELAGSSSLGDLNLSLTGVNDGDDNISDNYVSALHVDTAIAGIITVDLDATLRNIELTSDKKSIRSKGFAPTDITINNGAYSANNKSYFLDSYHHDRNVLYTLDGLTYLTSAGALYTENGTFAPRPASESDTFIWTSTIADENYCKSIYKFPDTGATYYYTTTVNGYAKNEHYDYYVGTNADGSKYVYRMDGDNAVRVQVRSIADTVLANVTRNAQGKIVSVSNRSGGIQWSRPWQAAYEAATAA